MRKNYQRKEKILISADYPSIGKNLKNLLMSWRTLREICWKRKFPKREFTVYLQFCMRQLNAYICFGNLASAGNPQISPMKPASFFNSMSEIASCSYEARAVGVRNGMFLGPARKLCPDIHCVPYQFNEYRKVSQRLYDILVTYSHEIEAVSCDEAYIDVSETMEGNLFVRLVYLVKFWFWNSRNRFFKYIEGELCHLSPFCKDKIERTTCLFAAHQQRKVPFTG